MADDQKDVAAPAETPKAKEPITDPKLFLDEAMDLIQRGEAGGLNTTSLMVRLGFKKGFSWVDELLGDFQFGAPRVKK